MNVRCVRTFFYDGLMRLVGDVWFEANYEALLASGNVVDASWHPTVGTWPVVIPRGPLPPAGP